MRVDKAKDPHNNQDIFFVRLTKKEALGLIASLTNQMLANNANTGRQELSNGEQYFSVSVDPEPLPKRT